jgi:hypothetical protein
MKKAKVTKFKNTLENQVILAKQTSDTGFVGKVIEEVLKKQGLPIDSVSAGPDISTGYYDIEIKTRKKGSNADISIGAISVAEIAACDYQNSIIKDKLQTIRWVEYDENNPFIDNSSSIVKCDDVLDFDNPRIQNEIEYHYNISRQEIVTNNDWYKVNSRVGWWEKKSKNSWAFRIPFTNWKNYITYNKTSAGFNNMFSNDDNFVNSN